jgi:hypothetical protein
LQLLNRCCFAQLFLKKADELSLPHVPLETALILLRQCMGKKGAFSA